MDTVEFRQELLPASLPRHVEGVENDTEAETSAEELTALLHQETMSRHRETLFAFVWSGVYFALLVVLMREFGASEAGLQVVLKCCIGFMGATGFIGILKVSRQSRKRRSLFTARLSSLQDKRQLGSLIRTLQVQNTPIRNLAKQRLIALLPTLHASDATLVGVEERKILLRQLAIFPNDVGYRDIKELFSHASYRREVDLRLAILKALEQIGGDYELFTVERLGRGLPTLHSAVPVTSEIRAAALACLPYLQARAADQRAESQLLRASTLPPASADDLLRPATLGGTIPPEQLLRADRSPS